MTLVSGEYGDAFTRRDRSRLTRSRARHRPTRWRSEGVPGEVSRQLGRRRPPRPPAIPGTVTVRYVPPATLPLRPLLPDGTRTAGKAVGFLNDRADTTSTSTRTARAGSSSRTARRCRSSRSRATTSGARPASPPQDSFPCINRLLRPQAVARPATTRATGNFTTSTTTTRATRGSGSKYADGCDPNLLGAVRRGPRRRREQRPS